jgi:hypothetical protein
MRSMARKMEDAEAGTCSESDDGDQDVGKLSQEVVIAHGTVPVPTDLSLRARCPDQSRGARRDRRRSPSWASGGRAPGNA